MYVPGPAQSVWWDADSVLTAVKRELRLQPAPTPDLDEERWQELIEVAGEMINTHLDRRHPASPPVPASWTLALVRLVVQLAGTGVTMSDGSVSTFTADDPMASVVPLLRGSKSRHGVA